MKRYPEPKLVGSLCSEIEKIDLSPDYQRNQVWKKEQKQLLIDTIFKGFDIPVIYTRIIEHDKYEVEVADGQQRITALIDFINNKIKLPDETKYKDENLAGKKYKDLTEEQKRVFENYSLNIIKLDATDKEIREMFKRFQNGTPLKNQEVRNAMFGRIRDEVREISSHAFFESVAFSNNRLKYDEMAATFMLLEKDKSSDKITQSKINKMYEEYYDNGLPEIKNKVLRVLDFLQNCFPDKQELENKSLLKKTTLTSLYLMVSELVDKYGETEIDNYIDDFSTWFQVFDKQKEEQKDLPENKQEKDMKTYIDCLSNNTNDPFNIQTRKDILIKKWEGYLKQVEKEKKSSKKTVKKQNKNTASSKKAKETKNQEQKQEKNDKQEESLQQENVL